MADYVANRGSLTVESVQALGFIVVGRTNVPEFGFKNISDAQFLPSSQLSWGSNPQRRRVQWWGGGAQGRHGATCSPLVTAGAHPIPASFCGLIGLKPPVVAGWPRRLSGLAGGTGNILLGPSSLDLT